MFRGTTFKVGDLICFKDDERRWGIIVSFSDDGSTVYYRPNGCGLFYSSVSLDKIMLG